MNFEFNKQDQTFRLENCTYTEFVERYAQEFTHYFRPRINFAPELFSKHQPEFTCFKLTTNDKAIGIFCGYVTSFGVFKMDFSVIHPDYRRKKLYSEYLKYLVHYCEQNAYTRITSDHSNSNNPIIIAKLQYDFYITNMQINPFYGAEIELTYFINKEMEEVFKFRCGDLSLPEKSNTVVAKQINDYREYFNRLVDQSTQ